MHGVLSQVFVMIGCGTLDKTLKEASLISNPGRLGCVHLAGACVRPCLKSSSTGPRSCRLTPALVLLVHITQGTDHHGVNLACLHASFRAVTMLPGPRGFRLVNLNFPNRQSSEVDAGGPPAAIHNHVHLQHRRR